eukprot:g5232.t1
MRKNQVPGMLSLGQSKGDDRGLMNLTNVRQVKGEYLKDINDPSIFLSGGGGLVSTVADYMRFCNCLFNGGHLDNFQLISRKTIEKMTTNQLGLLDNGLPKDMEMMMPDLDSGYSEARMSGTGFGLGFSVTLRPEVIPYLFRACPACVSYFSEWSSEDGGGDDDTDYYSYSDSSSTSSVHEDTDAREVKVSEVVHFSGKEYLAAFALELLRLFVFLPSLISAYFGLLSITSISLLVAFVISVCGRAEWRKRFIIKNKRTAVAATVRVLHGDELKEVVNDLKQVTSYQGFPAALSDHTSGSNPDVDYINYTLSIIWPYIRVHQGREYLSYMEDCLKAVQKSAPVPLSILRCKKFDFGAVPPRCNSIRSFSNTGRELTIDVDVEYFSVQETVVLEIGTSETNAVPVNISDIQLRMPLRILLKPLLCEPPYVGAVGLSYLHPPFFDFKLEATTMGLNVTSLPLVHEWLIRIIKSSITTEMLWPEIWWTDVSGLKPMEMAALSHLEGLPRGMMQIRVRQCQGLDLSKNISFADSVSQMLHLNIGNLISHEKCNDFYVQMEIGKIKLISKKNLNSKGGTSSSKKKRIEWDDCFCFIVDKNVDEQCLSVQLLNGTESKINKMKQNYDSSSLNGNEEEEDNNATNLNVLLGSGTMSLSHFKPNVPTDVTIPLLDVQQNNTNSKTDKRPQINVTVMWRPIQMSSFVHHLSSLSNLKKDGKEEEAAAEAWRAASGSINGLHSSRKKKKKRKKHQPWDKLPQGLGYSAHGILSVKVIKCSALPPMDAFNGKADPYVKLLLGDCFHVSTAKSATLNPKWTPPFSANFVVMDGHQETLRIEVWDTDLIYADDPIGYAKVNVRDAMILQRSKHGHHHHDASRSGHLVRLELPLVAFPPKGKVCTYMKMGHNGGKGFVTIELQWLALTSR